MSTTNATVGVQNPTAPKEKVKIDDLPSELHIQILKEYVEKLRSKGGLKIPSSAPIPVTAIFEVCTLWKDLLSRMPQLFDEVEFKIDLQLNGKRNNKSKRTKIKKVLDMLAWRLGIVGDHPIDLVLLSNDPEFEVDEQELPTNDMKRVQEVITDHAPYLRTLYEGFDVYGGCMYVILKDMEPKRYKGLTHLRLQAPLVPSEYANGWGKKLTFPSLTALSLELHTMHPVTALKEFNCPKLTSLVVSASSDIEVNITEFSNVLRKFPVLEEIFPEILFTFDQNLTPYQHTQVKHFVCTGLIEDALRTVMIWLHFPNVQEVTFTFIESLSPYFAFAWPRVMENITTFNIHASALEEDLFEEMRCWKGIAKKSPNLTRLTLGRTWDYDDLPRTELFKWRCDDHDPEFTGIYGDHSTQLLKMLCEEDPMAPKGTRVPLHWPGLEYLEVRGRVHAKGFLCFPAILKLRRFPNRNPVSKGKGELKLTIIGLVSEGLSFGHMPLIEDYVNMTYETMSKMTDGPF